MRDLRDDVSPGYLEWLRLLAGGADEREIARRLDVPVESLPTFSRLAAAKLLRAAQQEEINE